METVRPEAEKTRMALNAHGRRWAAPRGWWVRMSLSWAALVVFVLLVTIAVLVVKMKPNASDTTHLALYLALSGAIALAAGQLGLWVADATRKGGFRLKLAIPSILTALIIGFNVIMISRLMFLSVEDSELVLVFLAFGTAIALAIAWSVAGEVSRAVASIEAGARRIADGDYGWRIDETAAGGTTEVNRLAHWFNSMAASIQEAFARRDSAEAERRQVIAALSHDLRTPIASIRAMVEALDEGIVSDPTTVQRYIHTVRAEAGHLSALMDDLFELSRLEAGALSLHLERVSLEDILSDTIEGQREHAAQACIRLIGAVRDALPAVMLDARQMQRVVNNLLQNALRHTTPDGTVILHAGYTHASGQPGRIVVQVIDTGEGISAHDLPHIFEPTYRGEVSRRRSSADQDTFTGHGGLGLAIAQRIVEAHRGDISAFSPLDAEARSVLLAYCNDVHGCPAGAVLRFTLPVTTLTA
ncbi:MAG TPA: HAMP domain-containing sensor histidine kinase [Ktedonobacterales bacterium]|nr:HAMP domain-containing sensor histidine kinase [Ktedonobacterales bacterium]